MMKYGGCYGNVLCSNKIQIRKWKSYNFFFSLN